MSNDNPRTTACKWTPDEPDSGTWATECGYLFTINDGTPSQNRMGFCCYCGNLIKEVQDADT